MISLELAQQTDALRRLVEIADRLPADFANNRPLFRVEQMGAPAGTVTSFTAGDLRNAMKAVELMQAEVKWSAGG